jgi:type IV pilus assembly protein PilX
MKSTTHRSFDPMVPTTAVPCVPTLSQVPSLERGIALIIGLVILAVLSMIGVAAFSISTQEERMAGNSRDRIRAFEAAEAALRGCEDAVRAGPVFTATGGTGGMYLAPAPTLPSKAESIDWSQPGAVLPYTGTVNSEWSKPPACIAEQFSVSRLNLSPGSPVGQQGQVAHITAYGYGLNPTTVVKLESYYAM